MKKALFVLMALLIASPAMAVTLTADGDNATKTVTIGWAGNGADAASRARAFGLVITADNGAVFTAVGGFQTGEGAKYGIFPGSIVIADGVVSDYNTPVEPAGLPGAASSGIGTGKLVVALGSLYTGTSAPGASGTLLTVTVDKACTVTVAEEDTYRGGVVMESAEGATVDSVTATITADVETISAPTVTKTTAAPAVADKVNGGRTETFVATGATSSAGHALAYQFDFGDGVTGEWGAATQTHVYTYTAAGSYTVTVKARCAADTAIESAVSAPIVLSREAFKYTAAGLTRPVGEAYTAWAAWGRPNCWAFRKQCNGDADGLLELGKPVMNKDFTLFKAAFNKDNATLGAVLINGIPGICADFEKTAELNKRVMNKDIAIIKDYFNDGATAVPECMSVGMLHFYTN